ncbi:MAG: lipoyl domain-containing protein [Anaerolineae bacterium]
MSELKTVRVVNLHPRMEDTVLLDWLKQEGEAVRHGDPLYLLETRKGVFEVPSEHDGCLERLLVAAGAVVAADQEIALIRLVCDDGD